MRTLFCNVKDYSLIKHKYRISVYADSFIFFLTQMMFYSWKCFQSTVQIGKKHTLLPEVRNTRVLVVVLGANTHYY